MSQDDAAPIRKPRTDNRPVYDVLFGIGGGTAALAQGRYSAAITAATRASQLTKKILGQSAP